MASFRNRPRAFSFNSQSQQSQGLVMWAAACDGIMRKMFPVTKVLPIANFSVVPHDAFNQATQFGIVPGSYTHAGSTNQVIDTGLPGALDGLTNFTLIYWVYPLTTPDPLSGQLWGQGDASVSSFDQGGGPFLRGVTDQRGAFLVGGVTANEWQQLGYKMQAGVLSAIRNGLVVQSVNTGVVAPITPAATTGMTLGGYLAGTGGDPAGSNALWADFRVYNYALSDGQIAQLYDSATRWDLYAPVRSLERPTFSVYDWTTSVTPVPPVVLSGAKIIIKNRLYV